MSTRSPPPTMNTARPGLMQRMTRSPLRPVVILTSSLAGFWALLGAVGAFREMVYHNSHGFPHLGTIALAMGAVYGAITLTQVLGVVAAYNQKAGLVATYSAAAVFGGIAIAATGVIEVVEHFVLKNDLISECTKEVDGETVFFGWSFFGPSKSEKLVGSALTDFCNSAWNRDNISTVVSALVLSVYGVFLVLIARAFLVQIRDPSFGRITAPAPAHYAQPYPQYAAPPPGYAPYGGGPNPYAAPGQGTYAAPGGQGGFAPPPGPPPRLIVTSDTDKGYSAGAGPGLSDVSLETAKPRDEGDNPFADFERIPEHERDAPRGGRERYDV